MKKMRTTNEKDCIICRTAEDRQDFYYRPAGRNESVWLFGTDFSLSVLRYFREHGRMLPDNTFGLTVAQLYRFRAYENAKLRTVFERLPGMINYVLMYELPEDEPEGLTA